MAKKSNYGLGTARQLSNGSYEVRVMIGGKQKSFCSKTKREAMQRAEQAKADYNNGLLVVNTKMTLAQWLNVWQSDFCRNCKLSTQKRYEEHIRLRLKPLLGDKPLSKLSTVEVQRMCNHLSDELKLSPKTVRNTHGVLHEALGKAVELGYVKRNVSEGCELPRIVKNEMLVLSDQQVPIFMAEASGDQYRDVFFVALNTGMRENEVLGLSWAQVDFAKQTICVNRQLVRGSKKQGEAYRLELPKHHKIRTIKVMPKVMSCLRDIRKRQLEMRMRMGSEWQNTNDFVFTHADGKNYCDAVVRKHFKKIVEKMGMPKLRVHDLRHTFATLALQAGVDYKTLSNTLGHSDVAFTMNQYAHVSEAMRDNMIAKLEVVLGAN